MKPLLANIQLKDFLSFPSNNEVIELVNLNILIGTNGAGKSNLIEAISLIRSTPFDVQATIRKGGGVAEWVWKGNANKDAKADLEFVFENPKGKNEMRLRHAFSFSRDFPFTISDERIENENPLPNNKETYFYYSFLKGNPALNLSDSGNRRLAREEVDTTLSILSQRKDPDHYPEISYLSTVYEKCRIYREWSFGRNTIFREPQKADMRNDRLEEDFSNLGLFLNHLRKTPSAKNEILKYLKEIYQEVTDYDVSIEGGSVQVFFTEGEFIIPATRLSDGTLRYLCLLAILCDPNPPPLICIEEPELGLHPDIIPKIADLLIEASGRTQLIVTTHSEILVDCMTIQPESVIICEKNSGATSLKRLNKDELKEWLVDYRLGQLWTQGQIGGVRY